MIAIYNITTKKRGCGMLFQVHIKSLFFIMHFAMEIIKNVIQSSSQSKTVQNI